MINLITTDSYFNLFEILKSELKGKVNDEVPPVEPPKKKVTKEVPVPKLTETENFPFSEIDTSIENEFLTHDNIDSENEYIDDSLFSGMSDLYN